MVVVNSTQHKLCFRKFRNHRQEKEIAMRKKTQLHRLGMITAALGLLLSVAMPVHATAADAIKNPVREEDTHAGYDNASKNLYYEHKTTYSYVYFGSYPQKEILGAELTKDIINASYDANGDAVVNGKKYRRTVYQMADRTGTINSNSQKYYWDPYATDGYRYFLYEPIKWRVLNKDGNKLFLMCDNIVDYRMMVGYTSSDTWETCHLREWLNSETILSEDAARTMKGVPGFYKSAFTETEKKQILVTDVVQDENPYYKTKNGNDTKDKVFLLSFTEVTNPAYGFCKTRVGGYGSRLYECGNVWKMDVTEYATAMTCKKKDAAYGIWRLRTAGDNSNYNYRTCGISPDDKASHLWTNGFVYKDVGIGVVPAMNISYQPQNCIRVKFETNGAGTIEDQILIGSGPAKEPVTVAENGLETPLTLQKAGCAFNGWYTDAACTKRYEFGTVLTSDTTLYAGWKKAAPTGLSGGTMKIHGTTADMEYATSTGADAVWKPCTAGTTVVPSAGTWYVRYKRTKELQPSDAVKVTVISVDQAVSNYITANKIPAEVAAITDEAILNANKDTDIGGSTFATLQARADKTKTKQIRLKWKKVEGADGYIIYGAKCNKGKKKNAYKLIKTIDKQTTTSFTHKKLSKGTYYKYIVRAYKEIEGTKVSIAVSKTIHASTKGGSFGNAKSVTFKTSSKLKKKKGIYTLKIKKGKTYKLKASEKREGKKIKKHRAIAYETSNTAIATVSKKGVIKGKKKGTCYIYAYAQNGKFVRLTVKVE